jgi:hypothetical protein
MSSTTSMSSIEQPQISPATFSAGIQLEPNSELAAFPAAGSTYNICELIPSKVLDPKNPEDLHPNNFEDTDLCKRALELVNNYPDKNKIAEFLTSLTHSERESILIEIGDNCNFWAYNLDAPTIMTHWLIENGGLTFRGHTAMMFRIFEWFNAPNKEANDWMGYILDHGFTCEVLSEKQVRCLRGCVNAFEDEDDVDTLEFIAPWKILMQRLDKGLTARETELGITYTNMDKLLREYRQIEEESNDDNKDEQLFKIIAKIKFIELPEFIRKISKALA